MLQLQSFSHDVHGVPDRAARPDRRRRRAARCFQAPFGFVALLGVIALCGMIMRNSVILVDQIEQRSSRGLDPGTRSSKRRCGGRGQSC